MLLAILPCLSTPQVTLYPDENNVYGRAQGAHDSGVVRFLGRFNVTADCQKACLAYLGKDGALCHSLTHHLPSFPAPWATLCFGLSDHSWTPRPDATVFVSPPLSIFGPIPTRRKHLPRASRTAGPTSAR